VFFVVSVSVELIPNETAYIITPATFDSRQEADFDLVVYLTNSHVQNVEFSALPLPEPTPETIEPDPEPELSPEEIIQQLIKEQKIPAELLAELQIPTPEPKPEPEPEIKPEPKSEPKPEPEPSKPSEVPPVEEAKKPGEIPPPPVVKATIQPEASDQTGSALLLRLQQGRLRRVDEMEKQTSFAKSRSNLGNLAVNVERIIARRTALEYSDDEEQSNWSDHEDDDWW
jgi:outer membrane biosynthesis protein TonB